jgi:hypothetical protein
MSPDAPHNTCGHRAARVTLPERCCECGTVAHREGDLYEAWQPRGLERLIEPLMRLIVRRYHQPPQPGGRVTRYD